MWAIVMILVDWDRYRDHCNNNDRLTLQMTDIGLFNSNNKTIKKGSLQNAYFIWKLPKQLNKHLFK